MTSLEEVLAHHGVKGMKWGQRKSASPATTPAHTDAMRALIAKKTVQSHGTNALSNKELQDLVTRMNLEQQYSRLAGHKSTINKGHDAVKKVLGVTNTLSQVYNFVNSPAGKALASALKP